MQIKYKTTCCSVICFTGKLLRKYINKITFCYLLVLTQASTFGLCCALKLSLRFIVILNLSRGLTIKKIGNWKCRFLKHFQMIFTHRCLSVLITSIFKFDIIPFIQLVTYSISPQPKLGDLSLFVQSREASK